MLLTLMLSSVGRYSCITHLHSRMPPVLMHPRSRNLLAFIYAFIYAFTQQVAAFVYVFMHSLSRTRPECMRSLSQLGCIYAFPQPDAAFIYVFMHLCSRMPPPPSAFMHLLSWLGCIYAYLQQDVSCIYAFPWLDTTGILTCLLLRRCNLSLMHVDKCNWGKYHECRMRSSNKSVTMET